MHFNRIYIYSFNFKLLEALYIFSLSNEILMQLLFNKIIFMRNSEINRLFITTSSNILFNQNNYIKYSFKLLFA